MKIKSKNFINPTGNIFQEFNISTSEYWNALWKKYSDKDIKDLKQINQNKNDLVVKLSKRYLRTNASIIEAGCGLGQEVFKLENAGFDVTGIDSDENIIKRLNYIFPKNAFLQADVFDLSKIHQKFDGYWSFGVIEHFIKGYEGIAYQANKVLNANGYCFIIFTSMNFLSAVKLKLGIYKKKEIDSNLFHQFFLDTNEVKKVFAKQNFDYIEKYHMAGSIGACREISMPDIFKNRSKSKLIRGIWWLLNPLLSKITWHTTLLVFKKSS